MRPTRRTFSRQGPTAETFPGCRVKGSGFEGWVESLLRELGRSDISCFVTVDNHLVPKQNPNWIETAAISPSFPRPGGAISLHSPLRGTRLICRVWGSGFRGQGSRFEV